jgi:hypothetical protein
MVVQDNAAITNPLNSHLAICVIVSPSEEFIELFLFVHQDCRTLSAFSGEVNFVDKTWEARSQEPEARMGFPYSGFWLLASGFLINAL